MGTRRLSGCAAPAWEGELSWLAGCVKLMAQASDPVSQQHCKLSTPWALNTSEQCMRDATMPVSPN